MTSAASHDPALPHAPNSVGAWVLACRPATLAAAFVPVFVGTACAHHAGALRWGPAVAALFGAFMLQIGSNFANDVFDFEKGADTHERLGPPRAVQMGLLSPHAVRTGMFVVFALATASGVYLTLTAGWVVIAIGVSSIVAAIAYTGGPYPLGYHGLGDVFVMLFFGFVAVCGAGFVQAGDVPPLCWPCAAVVGSLATAILVVNNVRDRATDVTAGKRTLPVRFGRRFGELEYGALLLVAYVVPCVLVLREALEPSGLLPCLTLPLAVSLVRQVRAFEGKRLNRTLVATARLLTVYGVLLGGGIFLSAP